MKCLSGHDWFFSKFPRLGTFCRMLILVIPGFILQCSGRPTVQLYISPEIQKTFQTPLEAKYNEQEALKVLQELSDKGDEFCETLSGATKGVAFLKPPVPEKNKAKQNVLFMTKAGCSAWYEMTDRRPSDDFRKLVSETELSGKTDCFSTGFMQPYIMITHVPCDRLYITDISYRTQLLHLKLIQRILESNISLREISREFKFSYAKSAKLSETNKAMSLTPEDICPQENLSLCENIFAHVRGKLKKLKEIHLVYGPLHEFANYSYRKDSRKVFFLSNAIDPQFMPSSHFKTFLADMKIFTETSPVHLIYHMSGNTAYGVYKVESGNKTSLVCADKFITPASEKRVVDPCGIPITVRTKPSEYLTYLDKAAGIATKSNAMLCHK